MKKSRFEKNFLEELAKLPNISIACERLDISRQTIYRWMQIDPKFRSAVESALGVGNDSINDLAESKLIANIKSGNQRSIEYWLSNHKKNYYRPRVILEEPKKPEILSSKEKEELLKLLNL